VLAGDTDLLREIVNGDLFKAETTVVGAYTYQTTLGGQLTAPKLQVTKISLIGRVDVGPCFFQPTNAAAGFRGSSGTASSQTPNPRVVAHRYSRIRVRAQSMGEHAQMSQSETCCRKTSRNRTGA
jgi:hypothetical protein